jgi:integrase
VTRRALYDKLTKLSEISKVEFRPHDLRRTFGNRHWRAGTPIETIAHLMGHESIDMTFRAYIGVQYSDMLQAQRRLCPSAPIQLEAPR